MKTFLLLAAASVIGLTASAQGRYFDHRYGHSQGRHIDTRIDDINRDYDSRIERMRCEPGLRRRDRRRQIRQLERERTVALRNCRSGYSVPYGSGYSNYARPSAGVTVHFGF